MLAEKMNNLSISKMHSIVKSENDKREYKYLILNNKLRLLLISDPTTEKSAASVNVNVGHSSDPDSVAGIAHFCEHMLFLGTEKYPVEDEFSQFLSQNGGSSNASTSGEHTNYHFDVKSDALLPALDRFAQFFISPLFDSDSTDRELNAIDSEHQKNILNDSRRMYYINKVTSKPGHVYQKFGTGNLETLKTIPAEKNIDIRQLLLDFHTKYYSANIITVCILGKDTIEEIEKFTVPLFDQVKNKDVIVPECKEFPYGEEEKQVILKVPTIKEMKKVELKFTIPDYGDHYMSNPCHYLSHLIGHEGKGSLLSMLKKKTWVNALWAGSHRGLKGFEFFNIGMDLSEEGMNHIDEIVDICFMYINMLREGEELWVFNEMKMLNEISFRFKDKEQPHGYVTSLTKSMHSYQPEDVLYGHYKLETFSPDLIKEVLSYLVPTNMRITLASQTYKGKTDRTVKYYDAEYSLEKISKERIEKLENIGKHPELHLPKKNIFIPNNLDVSVSREEKDVKSVPVMIKNTNIMRVWYKADDTFFLPKSSLKVLVSSPNACLTPLHFNLLSMFIRLVRDEMVEFGYDAELAGIKYSVDWTSTGFQISISGFSSNQLVLLKKILEYVSQLEVKEERFDVNKEELEEQLKNVELSEPYMLVEGVRNYVVSERNWSSEERLECIGDVSITRLKGFIAEFLKCIFIECLMCGNLLVENVNEICDVVEEKLIKDKHARPMLPTQHLLVREHKLPKHSNYLYEKRCKIHSNSCVQVYFQVGLQEEKSNVLCELFAQMTNAPFFQTLRTKEQLGYIVFSGLLRSTSVQGLCALIQSDKPPSVVEERIDSFFELFEETLKEMSDEQFKDYIDALVVKKLEKPKRIQQEANKYWVEIAIKQYHFRRNLSEVEVLKTLTRDDIMKFFKTYIAPSSNERKKIVIAILGKDAKCLSEEEKPFETIDNILSFKSSLPLYPHVKSYSDVPLLVSTSSKL